MFACIAILMIFSVLIKWDVIKKVCIYNYNNYNNILQT